LKNLASTIRNAGAGVSVSAGIPDFRSSQGLFTTGALSKDLLDANVWKVHFLWFTHHYHQIIDFMIFFSDNHKGFISVQNISTNASEMFPSISHSFSSGSQNVR
jgi:NAD-dependent SIR2 family protein deacetylase